MRRTPLTTTPRRQPSVCVAQGKKPEWGRDQLKHKDDDDKKGEEPEESEEDEEDDDDDEE